MPGRKRGQQGPSQGLPPGGKRPLSEGEWGPQVPGAEGPTRSRSGNQRAKNSGVSPEAPGLALPPAWPCPKTSGRIRGASCSAVTAQGLEERAQSGPVGAGPSRTAQDAWDAGCRRVCSLRGASAPPPHHGRPQ